MKAVLRAFWATVTMALVVGVIGVAAWVSSPRLRLLVREVVGRAEAHAALPGVVPVALNASFANPTPRSNGVDVATAQRRIGEIVEMFGGLAGAAEAAKWISADSGLARELLNDKALIEFGFDVARGGDEATYPALVRVRFVFDWSQPATTKFDFNAWRTFELAAELAGASQQLGQRATVNGYFVTSRPTGLPLYTRRLALEAKELLVEALDGTGGVAVKTRVLAVPHLLMQP